MGGRRVVRPKACKQFDPGSPQLICSPQTNISDHPGLLSKGSQQQPSFNRKIGADLRTWYAGTILSTTIRLPSTVTQAGASS